MTRCSPTSHAITDALFFGVEDDTLALPGMAHAADAKHCRRCGAPYSFEAIYLGHLGHYRCPGCGQQRPTPSVTASKVYLEGVRAARFLLRTPTGEREVALALPGLYNVYNALAAAALASALEVPLETIAAGLSDARAAFGRAETVTLSLPANRAKPPATRELQILLDQEPRRHQRGAAHARARARRARSARRAQRPDRRRP